MSLKLKSPDRSEAKLFIKVSTNKQLTKKKILAKSKVLHSAKKNFNKDALKRSNQCKSNFIKK